MRIFSRERSTLVHRSAICSDGLTPVFKVISPGHAKVLLDVLDDLEHFRHEQRIRFRILALGAFNFQCEVLYYFPRLERQCPNLPSRRYRVVERLGRHAGKAGHIHREFFEGDLRDWAIPVQRTPCQAQ